MAEKAVWETDLYPPVKALFESQGYRVRGEVKGCDLVASKNDFLVIVELKISVNMRLLIQTVDRLSLSPNVYMAVPEPPNKRSSHWRGVQKILKMLGLGLILVTFGKTGTRAQIAFDPADYRPPRNVSKLKKLKKEFEGRSSDHNIGGSHRTPLITRYKEEAIFIACCLEKHGPLSPKGLKNLGAGDNSGSILLQNHYGWFDHPSRGIYAINEKGVREARKHYEIYTKSCAMIKAKGKLSPDGNLTSKNSTL